MVVGGSGKTPGLDQASAKKVAALSFVGKHQESVGIGGKEKGML